MPRRGCAFQSTAVSRDLPVLLPESMPRSRSPPESPFRWLFYLSCLAFCRSMKRPESRAQSQLVVPLPAIPLALLLQLPVCPPKKRQRLAMLDPFVRLIVTRKELQAPDHRRCRRGGSRSARGLKGWVREAFS